MRIGPFQFKPKLWSTILMLIVVGICLMLANWQRNRAHYKTALLQQYKSRPKDQILNLATVKKNPKAYQYQRIRVLGHYLERSLLLDNRMHGKKVGNMVLTPFRPLGSKKVILVNRGWVALNHEREITAHIPQVAHAQSILGLVRMAPEKIYVLKHKEKKISWPWRVQAIDLKKISKGLGHPVAPFLILLAPDQPYGFVRNWQPTTTTKAEKHWGYAFQWLALGVTFVIIYLVLSTRRNKKANYG